MLKDKATAIDGFVVFAPAEISVVFLEFPAAATLFFVPMILFIVGVDSALTSVAPNDGQERTIEFNVHGHSTSVR
ncbi:MAG: hypothetical protein Aurels2KO_57660 [Aureliella sp.]